MKTAGIVATALAAAVVAGLAGFAAAQDEYGGLPPGEGREVVHAICSGCHSIRLVTQQGMSRKRWAKTLDWMTAEQGMPELDPETRSTVLDYLAEHVGEPPVRQGPNPFNRVQPLQPMQ